MNQGRGPLLLIGKAQQQTFGTARSTGLDLGEDGDRLGTLCAAGRGHEPADFDRASRLLQRPGSRPPAGARRSAPPCDSDPPAQQTIAFEDVVDMDQRCLIRAERYRSTLG